MLLFGFRPYLSYATLNNSELYLTSVTITQRISHCTPCINGSYQVFAFLKHSITFRNSKIKEHTYHHSADIKAAYQTVLLYSRTAY